MELGEGTLDLIDQLPSLVGARLEERPSEEDESPEMEMDDDEAYDEAYEEEGEEEMEEETDDHEDDEEEFQPGDKGNRWSDRVGRKRGRMRATTEKDSTEEARAIKRTRQQRAEEIASKPYSELTLEELMSLSVRRERRSRESSGDAQKDAEEREKEAAAEEEEKRRKERERREEVEAQSSLSSAIYSDGGVEEREGEDNAEKEENGEIAEGEGDGEENNSLDDEMILVNGRIEIREREESSNGAYSPPQERQGGRYRKKPRASADRWNQEDTREFYRGLRMYGTDFTAIAMLLPNRSRGQVKNKYKKEEKENPSFIDFALMNPTDEDAPISAD